MWNEIKGRPSSKSFCLDSRTVTALHDRCVKSGVRSDLKKIEDVWSGDELNSFLEKYQKLRDIAWKLFVEVYEQLEDSTCVLIVTDGKGRTLELYSLPDILNQCKVRGIKQGGSLGVRSCGTNAVERAITMKRPIVLRGEQHFSALFKKWFCIAVPIINLEGVVIGCVDFSSSHTTHLDAKLPLIQMLAKEIQGFMNEDLGHAPSDHGEAFRNQLTPRQKEILELLVSGKDLQNKQVAATLSISPKTVEQHRYAMRKKFGATTRQLILGFLGHWPPKDKTV
jgi:transcriptional regulator of acetoin/glycerol metabolism